MKLNNCVKKNIQSTLGWVYAVSKKMIIDYHCIKGEIPHNNKNHHYKNRKSQEWKLFRKKVVQICKQPQRMGI